MKFTKKIIYFIFLFITLFPLTVDAASYYGVSTGSGVSIRNAAGKSGTVLDYASLGELYDMPNNILYPDDSKQGCPNGWYQIYYKDSKVGYICSNYLKIYEKAESVTDSTTPTTDCERQMQQAGFPSSYWNGLCSLKASHSNWNFQAMVKDANGNTIDWNQSVYSESSCGANYISTSNDSYKSTTCTKSGDAGYSPVSEEAVRYYMNPTNFLNEVNIFMFESQTTNPNISQDVYKTASTKIFGNNFLISQIPLIPEYIKNSSNETGVSQIALATRIKQELGNAKLTSGTYSGQLYSVVSGDYTSRYNWTYNNQSVDNYYNFFNVAAYDGSNVTQQALIYALNHGWGGTGDQNNDRQIAMTGGANFLKNKYIGAGQNTIYFQKFNIFPTNTSSRYLNQYMTNIQAPVSESSIVYNAYKAANVLDSSFTFYIPVFSGMNVNSSSSNDSSNQETNSKPSVSTIVTSSGFRYADGYISNINPGTNINDVKSALESKGASVTITNADGNEVSGNIGTGYRININGSNSETLIAVIYGDVSGDGNINALDLLKVQKNILGTATLNGSSKVAADPSKDGNINALDLLKIQKQILNTGNIEQ